MISIVCVFNDKIMLNKFLIKGLKNQTEHYELILIDNTKNKFKSAANALNSGAKNATGTYVMFVHQDVVLCSDTWLEEAEKIIESIGNNAIVGIVGMSEKGINNKLRGRNIIIHGDPPEKWGWGNLIEKSEIVQTLDECLIIIPKSIFDTYKFDEKTCQKWDLYVVEYCLNMKKNDVNSYVMPLSIYHRSTGVASKNYFDTLKKVLKKHKHIEHVYTTCGDWNNKYPLLLQKYSFILLLQMFLNKINARKLRISLKRKFKHEY